MRIFWVLIKMAKHIDLKQRMQIEKNLELGKSVPEIARLLGRHKSSIYDEISQNTDQRSNSTAHFERKHYPKPGKQLQYARNQ